MAFITFTSSFFDSRQIISSYENETNNTGDVCMHHKSDIGKSDIGDNQVSPEKTDDCKNCKIANVFYWIKIHTKIEQK